MGSSLTIRKGPTSLSARNKFMPTSPQVRTDSVESNCHSGRAAETRSRQQKLKRYPVVSLGGDNVGGCRHG